MDPMSPDSFAQDAPDAALDGDEPGHGAVDLNGAAFRTPGERWAACVAPFVLPALLVIGVLVLIVKARAALGQAPRFVVDPTVCAVTARPAWVSDAVARSIAMSVACGLGRQASLLDGKQLQGWADVLTDPQGGVSPWIESVERLAPHFPSQADLRVRLRLPVMLVEGDLLVSASGHVLGPGPVSLPHAPLTYVGRHLDEDYRECAAAAGELQPFRAELERAGVRVVAVGVDEHDTVTFTTDVGVELSWGRSARKSSFSSLDLPPTERVGNLRQVLLDFPGLAGLRRVQLWTDRPVTTRRAS